MKKQVRLPIFDRWQEVAKRKLAKNYQPPQRYGTAFHVRPPWSDVRDIPLLSRGEWQIAEAKKILASDLKFFGELEKSSDTYLHWQLANLSQTNFRIILVRPGEERHVVWDDKSGQSELCLIVISDGASCEIIDTVMNTKMAVRRLFVWQKRDSSFVFHGWRSQVDFLNERVDIRLVEQGARARVNHLTYFAGREQSDVQVTTQHTASDTESRLEARLVGLDHSRSIYRGLLDIEQKAKGSTGYQSGKALLLNSGAVVDILPQLNIRTNDVRCSHGVTTTHLDELKLFYMRARGLTIHEATQLAVLGFYHHQLALPPALTHTIEDMVYGSVSPAYSGSLSTTP